MGRIKQSSSVKSLSEYFTEEELAYYQENPIDFIYEQIFHEDAIDEETGEGELYLSDQQIQVLEALADPEITNISVVSGKGVGKTALMALAVIWFITCFANPKVVLTAPSFPQLKSALWPEVAKWLKRSLVKDLFEYTSERLYYKDEDHKENWWAEPRTSSEKENMQGLHADNMLLIVDEGSGVDDEIFEALDTTMTADENKGINKLLTMGNGTKTDGVFYESHHRFKHEWATFSFSSLDSPFVNDRKIKKLIEKYGWDHDVVRTSVRGLFPRGNPDSLIPLYLVEQAVEREVKKTNDIHVGVDCARFGDDLTVLTWREGLYVHEQISKGKTSTDETVGMVLSLIKSIRKQTGHKGRIPVKIDDTGLGGGVTDYLKLDREHNIEVIPVNFACKSSDDMYQNTPSHIWGTIRDKIEEIRLPDDDFLKAELSARTFKVPNGKIMIQSKSEFKKDFKESPDKSDSLGLCLFEAENQRTVLKDFDMCDSSVVKPVIEYTANMRKIISIWYSKDMLVSIVYGAWDGFRLHVLQEYIGDDNSFTISHFLNGFGREAEIIGNHRMFGDSSADIKSQYRRMGVRVRKNRKYDDMGAVQVLSNFIKDKRVVLQSNCKTTITQLDDWNVYDSQNSLETSYGACYAISNLVSYVKENAYTPYTTPVDEPTYQSKYFDPNKVIVNPIAMWATK